MILRDLVVPLFAQTIQGSDCSVVLGEHLIHKDKRELSFDNYLCPHLCILKRSERCQEKNGIIQKAGITAEWPHSPQSQVRQVRTDFHWMTKSPNLMHIPFPRCECPPSRLGMPRSRPTAGKGLNQQSQTSCETKLFFILCGLLFLDSAMWHSACHSIKCMDKVWWPWQPAWLLRKLLMLQI